MYLEKEAHAEFLALQSRAPDVACDIRIEESDQPWRSILAVGEAVNASLIVLAERAWTGLVTAPSTTVVITAAGPSAPVEISP